MKKLVNIALVLCFILPLGVNSASAYGKQELVEKVLKGMRDDKSTLRVSELISPAYMSIYKVSASDYKVNTYGPVGYAIDKVDGNHIEARIWGNNKSWIHRLHFLVSNEGGTYYLVPGDDPSTYGYVDPWYKVESNIKDEEAIERNPSGKKEIVQALLNDMTYGSGFGTKARKYIAPSYYRSNYLSKSQYNINAYSPKGFEVDRVSGNYVYAYIWGADKSWVHKLTFKVVVEDGNTYVYPKGHTDNDYIHPWYEVETNVSYGTTNNNLDEVGGTGLKFDDREKVVTKLMDAMLDRSDGNFSKDMRLFIAPSYYKDNNLNAFDYSINAYSPVGYKVTKNDGYGNIEVLIWGKGKGWTRTLVFKVVKENNLLYLMPGAHHSSTQYVDPWYSTTTD